MENVCYDDNLFEVIPRRIITKRLLLAVVSEANSKERNAIYSIRSQILNNSFKAPMASVRDGCCGCCGKPFNSGQGDYCMYCGCYNAESEFISEHISKFALRVNIESILADAVITANDPELFLECLNAIEKPETEKKYAELSEKVIMQRNTPDLFCYRCGVCNLRIHSGREILEEPRFCPHCGIPFKRVRYTVREENGFEQTILRKPYRELFP